MCFESTEERLKERVKELACLYEISKIISQSNQIEKKVLKRILFTIKKAWKYSNDAVVEIQIDNFSLSTSKINYKTVSQTAAIKTQNFIEGLILVHYPGNKYSIQSFLTEEQKLLNTIAFEIANYVDKIKNTEKEMVLQRRAERTDRLSILGEITAGIAHEINNPLANILGFAELIKNQNTDTVIDSDISTIISSVIYSREIVKKLLYFSREMPQQLKLEEIKPIVLFAVSFLKQNFQKKKIRNEILFKDDNIAAKVDSVQLTQVLFNLLINAIYASPADSTIKILVEHDLKNLFISITDEGTGIPEKIKTKIFEPFFTTKPNNDGNGLGLSVVHGIIKNHNGEIIVKDHLPKGTIFTIKLPI